MIDKLRKELWELRVQIGRRASISKELEENHRIESAIWREEYQVRTKLNQLNGRMAELQKRSIRNMYYNMIGQKEEMLHELEEEARLVEVELRDLQRTLEECGVKLKSLEATYQGFGDPERRFRDTYEKLKNLLREDPLCGAEVVRLEKAVNELDKQLREIGQAVSAGGLAMQEARSILGTLRSARGYGALDMAGGGVVAGAAKYKKLNDARKQSEELRSRIARFNSELTDVNIGLHLGQDNVGNFLRFADFFLDGLLADWAVQTRIGESQAELSRVEGSLHSMVNRLQDMYRTLEHERQKLKDQLTGTILGPEPEVHRAESSTAE